MKRDAALAVLRAAAPELRSRYGVVGAPLFGSVARDDADDKSDRARIVFNAWPNAA